MSASPFSRSEARVPPDRMSDAPMALDLSSNTGSTFVAPRHPARAWLDQILGEIPQAWLGMSGYLVAGVCLGLVLIVALSLARGGATNSAAASAGVVTDNVVHLDAKQISAPCWRGVDTDTAARVTVSLEVGLDGKVRNARAAGESAAMRACIEAHVKGWEFLPQANPSQMVLPFEIDPR